MLIEGGHRVEIQILPADAVLPHEIADQQRERRIERRLREDRILRDPLIVGTVPDLENYVLLDGTNRKRALVNLEIPWVMAQVLDYADHHTVQLRTWCHAAHLPVADLTRGSEEIPGVEVDRLPPLAAPDALQQLTTLAVLLDRTGRYLISRVPGSTVPRPQQLRQLVDIYENQMVREDCDPDDVEERSKLLSQQANHPVTLVAFPPFTRSQVVAMAMQGTLIPSGITRHIVLGGRALRVNLPLETLGEPADLPEVNARLQEHLSGLQPRVYREPTILFDS